MKRAALLLALLAPGLAASAAPEPPPWQVQAEVRMIAVPMAEAIRLVPQLRRAETFAAGETRVQALLAGGEAELVDWAQARCLTGWKTESESREEVRFGTEWNPTICPFFPPTGSPFREQILAARSPEPRKLVLWQSPAPSEFIVPMAFETEYAGASLEFEATVKTETGELTIRMLAKLTRLEAIDGTIRGRPGDPTFRGLPKPRFITCRVQTELRLANGGDSLLGTFSLREPKSRLLLFLLHATARPQPRRSP